jgi:hypothetical protein
MRVYELSHGHDHSFFILRIRLHGNNGCGDGVWRPSKLHCQQRGQ